MSLLWVLLPVGSVALIWGVCAALSPAARPGGSRFAAAAVAMTPGLLALFALAGATELVRLAAGNLDPSGLVGIAAGGSGGARTIDDALAAWVRLSGLLSLPLLLGCLVGTFRQGLRETGARFGGVGLAQGLGGVITALVALGLALSYLANPGAVATVLPPELSAVVCLAGLSLSLRLSAAPLPAGPARRMPSQAPRAEASPARIGGPDPVALLLASRLISGNPEHEFPAAPGTGAAPAPLDRLWQAVGGEGPAPDGLAESLQAVADDESVLIPDLPGGAEELFLAAALTHAILAGRRSLAIVPRPAALRERIVGALDELGEWPPGPICASPSALGDLAAARRIPALLLLEPAAASNLGIPYLASGGQAFADALSLVVVSRPDRLGGVPSAHLHFTMARLALHPRVGGKPRAAIVTALGTSGILVGVKAMLGENTRRIPIQLKARERVRIFRGTTQGGTTRSAIVQAVRESIRVLSEAGLQVSIEDSADLLNAEDLGPDQRRVLLDPPGTLRGDVCLCVLALREISPTYRVAPHRSPGESVHGQVVVEWVAPTPMSNFLMAPGRLEELGRLRTLPAPMPLSGAPNSHLQRLHLMAALHEGTPWETALREAFRNESVSALIRREDALRGGRRARLDQRRGTVQRSWMLHPARGGERPDTSRETVTPAEVRVVDGAEGSELARIDRITAATHFYPYRVFGIRGRRYHVPPGGGLDESIKTITVWPVGEEREPTIPGIRFDLQLREWVGEFDRLDERGIALVRRKASVTVTEEISSALEVQSGRRFSFEPVHSTYNSELLIVHLEHLRGRQPDQLQGLRLIAALLDEALLLHLRVADENLQVQDLPQGFAVEHGGSASPSLAFVDRHVGGIGMADVLTPHLLAAAFKWSRASLHSCPCMDGCERCTPPAVLDLRAKQDGIQMMGS